MNVRNYQKKLEKTIERLQKEGSVPRLLLHSCCAPCSSYCLIYLAKYFKITVFYYNPNISQEQEYRHRVQEQIRLIGELNQEMENYPVDFVEGDYIPQEFYEVAKGYEHCEEGGERCFRCYELRLRKTAEYAAAEHYDYFTTTLTISPLKNAEKLNEIGEKLAAECGVAFLNSDFKKKNGYKTSVELSKKYDLYRQNYCGCAFSKAQAEREGRI
jgi:hypothetical protein